MAEANGNGKVPVLPVKFEDVQIGWWNPERMTAVLLEKDQAIRKFQYHGVDEGVAQVTYAHLNDKLGRMGVKRSYWKD